MAGHQCYHCKQWIDKGEAHDCWTTTEAALTADLSEDLREAWDRLRETAAELGAQRIYASHKSIMFSRATCYAFCRPKRSFLEVCLFLGRRLTSPQVRRADAASKAKVYHIFQIRHRDQVEAPFTDWLREAYEFSQQPVAGKRAGAATTVTHTAQRSSKATTKAKPKPVAARAAKQASRANVTRAASAKKTTPRAKAIKRTR